jgi:HEPN domain-containing protein
MPEDFKKYISRLYEHAKKHIGLLKDALESDEYDTADFLAQVVVQDLVKLREVINTQLRFSKSQK